MLGTVLLPASTTPCPLNEHRPFGKKLNGGFWLVLLGMLAGLPLYAEEITSKPVAVPPPAFNGPLLNSTLVWDAESKSIDVPEDALEGRLLFSLMFHPKMW
jgi:hypothetical protein